MSAFDFSTGTANYYTFLPNRESVTLYGPNGSSLALPWNAVTYDSWPVTDCHRRAPTTKEIIKSGGGILSNDLVWLLPEAVRPSAAVPKPGYYLHDTAGVDWTVLEVMPLGRFGQTWRLVTRNLAAHFALTQLATVSRADATADASGKRMSAYTAVYTAVRCRLQEQIGSAELVHDGRVAVRRFDLITTTRILLAVEDKVVVGGLTFTVTGWTNPDKIGEPMTVQLELVS